MIHWALLETVQLVNPAILGNEGDEVGVAMRLHIGNPLTDCMFVFIQNFLAVLKNFGPGLAVLTRGVLAELIEEGVGNQYVWVFFFGVEDHVE